LLRIHEGCGGFQIAPGAHAALQFDIVSEAENFVAAETFAAVDPRNNRKLERDLKKLSQFPNIKNRFVFFMCPRFPETKRQSELEHFGIQVWSVSL
jgi:hypothetical protein